jgi:hypothetical protein
MARFLNEILEQFSAGGDPTRFGLMNAVTAVARDTRDPDDRWRLEEFGGAVGATLEPSRPSGTGGARREPQPVAVEQ